MKIAIISLQSGSSKMLAQRAEKYFEQVDMIDIRRTEINVNGKGVKVIYNGQPLPEYDCVYCKGSYKYALLARGITLALQGKCYLPLSPESYSIGHDKFLTLLYLQRHKIDMPTTYLAGTTKAAKSIVEQIHYPAILKIPSGTHGKGVMFADSRESAKSILDMLEVFNQPYIIQEYIESDATDIRALVVGDKVIGSMKRRAVKGEIRANIHMGATGENYILDYDTKRLAVKSAQAIGADICAVDILQSGRKSVVIEVNVSPGIQGLTKATKKDIADAMASFLCEKTKEFKKNSSDVTYKDVLKELEISSDTHQKEIVTNLDIRAGIIRLPSVITKVTGFTESDDVSIKVEKGKLIIQKH